MFLAIAIRYVANPTVRGTLFGTMTANVASGSAVRINNFSASFDPIIDYLQVEIVNNNLTSGNTTVIVGVTTY